MMSQVEAEGRVDDSDCKNINVGSSTNPTGGILLNPEAKLKMSSKVHSVSPAIIIIIVRVHSNNKTQYTSLHTFTLVHEITYACSSFALIFDPFSENLALNKAFITSKYVIKHLLVHASMSCL